MTIAEIKTRIEEFKAIKAKWSITPAILGGLLKDILIVAEAAYNAAYDLSQNVPALAERIEALESKMDGLPENVDAFTFLDINVGESKTRFIDNDNLTKVWNAMQENKEIPVAIYVNYASGLKVLFIATCIKQNYISLHAKAGSCELRLNQDGTFSINGTSLW